MNRRSSLMLHEFMQQKRALADLDFCRSSILTKGQCEKATNVC